MWPERLFLQEVACYGVVRVLYTRGLGLEPLGGIVAAQAVQTCHYVLL